MATLKTPILDLDTLVDRPVVKIDGHEYELLTHDLLAPIDGHRMSRSYARIGVLLDQPTLSDDEERELEALPDRMCRLVLDAPDPIHAALTSKQRMAILSTFSNVLPLRPRAESTAATVALSTGAS
jgi:hypothetical protein